MALHDGGLEIVSVGDLVPEGIYCVHSRFSRAVNLTDGASLITVAVPSVGAGPRNIVIRGCILPNIERLRVSAEVVTLNGMSLPYDRARVYSSSIVIEHLDLPGFRRQLRVLEDLLVELAPPRSLAFLLANGSLADFRAGFEQTFARHVSQCVKDILRHDTMYGLERLAGCGFGLTPSGDDFVAGALTAMSVVELATGRDLRPVREHVLGKVRTSNVVSDTLLSLAAEGRVSESVKGLVGALGHGSCADVRTATEKILAHGSTSGADFAVGLCIFLRSRLLVRTSRFTAYQ